MTSLCCPKCGSTLEIFVLQKGAGPSNAAPKPPSPNGTSLGELLKVIDDAFSTTAKLNSLMKRGRDSRSTEPAQG
jgi:hypothetical protein